MLDLSAPAGEVGAVQELDQHRNVAGLDQVEQVFPEPVDQRAHEGEAGDTAPRTARAGVAADVAEGIADARTAAGGDHVGEGDPEIDEQAKTEKRGGAPEQAEHLGDVEIHHGPGASVLRVRRSDTPAALHLP